MLEKRISELVKNAQTLKEKEKAILDTLRQFTSMLYVELEKIIESATSQGAPDLGKVKKRKLDAGLESLSFEWRRYRIIISPLDVPALPSSSYETSKNPLAILAIREFNNEAVARVIVFLQYINDTSVGTPFGEIYVSTSGQWFASGMVFNNQTGNSIDSVQLGFLAISILETILHGITSHHRSLSETKFDPESQGTKNTIGFNL